MSVYREIPFSFGTLVLVHPAENPDAVRATLKVPPLASLYQAPNTMGFGPGALDADAKERPDLEIVSVESLATSETEQRASVPDDVMENMSEKVCDNRHKKEHSGVSAEFPPKRSPLSSLCPHDDSDGTSSDLCVKIGPTTRGTETAQKPHVCDICGRPFRRRKDIRRHRCTHSNVKPFYCWACCLTFRSRDYLRRHLKRVHSPGQWYLSEYGEQRSGLLQVRQQQDSVEDCPEPRVSEQDMTEHRTAVDQQDSPSQRRFAEDVVEDVATSVRAGEEGMRNKDGNMDVENANLKSHMPAQRTVTSKMVNDVLAPSKSPSQPQPKATDTSEQNKAVSARYLCDGCSNIMSHNDVMVLGCKPGASASKPRVLCKGCIIQKTGIICIG